MNNLLEFIDIYYDSNDLCLCQDFKVCIDISKEGCYSKGIFDFCDICGIIRPIDLNKNKLKYFIKLLNENKIDTFFNKDKNIFKEIFKEIILSYFNYEVFP